MSSPNSDGLYKAGDQLIIQVEFASPVTISGVTSAMRLQLNSGGEAAYIGQSGGGTILNFRYTVAGPVGGVGGDNAADLDVRSDAAIINATFSDSNGPFVPSLPFGIGSSVTNSLAYMSNIVIDTTPPTQPQVMPDAVIPGELRVNPAILDTNPAYAQLYPDYFTLTGTAGTGPLAAGETLTIEVNGCTYVLDRNSVGAPNASGVWRVDLRSTPTSGGPLSPWSSTALQRYQVVATSRDAAGNTSVGYGAVVIDSTAPTIVNVTAANPDGAYKKDDVIDVQVFFLEPVTVVTNNGTPKLALALSSVGGGPAGRVWATYDASKSSGTCMVFSYTVQAGDTAADLEYQIIDKSNPTDPTTAIVLNSGMIQDLAGNPADLSMPTPSATTSGTLGYNKNIIIDTTAPAAPLITFIYDDVPGPSDTDIPNGGVTNDPVLVIKGTTTGTDAVSVRIYRNGVALSPTVPVGNNAWSFTTPSLADATYTFAAATLDAAGNESVLSAVRTLTVDTAAPAAPVVLQALGVANNGYTKTNAGFSITGTAEPNSTINLWANSNSLGASVTASPSGNWIFTYAGAALADGVYVITAQATDKAGNVGPTSTAYTVTIDTLAPAIPVILGVVDDIAPLTMALLDSQRTNDTCPSFSGTCTSDTVAIDLEYQFNGGTTWIRWTSATVASGTWSATNPTPALVNGPYKIRAKAFDAAGNSSTSTDFNLTVDTVAPNPPLVTGVAGATGQNPPTVANGGRTNRTTLVISGTVVVADGATQVEVLNGSTSLGLVTPNATTGIWSFTTGTLADGTTYSFTAKATDAAGNVSGSSAPPYVVTVDTTAPAAPVITDYTDDVGTVTGSIASGGVSNDTLPILSGTMEAGTTSIEIWDGTTQVTGGTLVLDSATAWRFSPPTALTDGLHRFTAVAIDGAGNRSTPSLSYDVTVDTVGLVPSITGVADNVLPITGNVPNPGSTDDTVLVLTGTAEAGSTVSLYNDVGTSPVLLGNPTLTGTGWTFTTGTLAAGTYNFKVQIVDAAGNVSALSPAYTVTVDLTAPARPTITGIVDDVAEITGPVPNGGVTNDTNLMLQGQAEPGALVLVYNGLTLFGQATADPTTGAWSMPTGLLVDGTTYSFTATATDAAGNVSDSSLPPYSVTIDLSAPAAPVITSVSDNTGSIVGALTSGGSTDDTTLTIVGTTAAGTRLDILINGTKAGSAIVNGTTWNFTTPVLAPGLNSIQAQAYAAGTPSYSSLFLVTVITQPPAIPTIERVLDDATQRTGQVARGGVTNDTVLELQGVTEPNTAVSVYNGGTLLGSASVVGTMWSFTTSPLANGSTLSFTATATDAVGNTSAPTVQPFTVTIDTANPLAPVVIGVYDDATGALIPNGGLTNAVPTIRGSGEPNASVQIFNGTTPVGPVLTIAPDGTWSYQLTALTSGVTYSFNAQVTDSAGNMGPKSSPDYLVTVDYIAPVAPAISDVVDDVAPVTGSVADGGASNDTTLMLAGTAPLDAVRINIYNNGVFFGFTTANSGAWSFPAANLVNGTTYLFTATALDAAGNESGPSVQRSVTIDTVAPTTPVIAGVTDDVAPNVGAVLNGGYTNDTSLALTITTDATPGLVSSVTVYDGTTQLGMATLSGPGQWTYLATGLLDGATYNFRAVATDAAGNFSSPSAPFVVNVDTTAPNPPTLTASSQWGIVTLSGTTEQYSSIKVFRNGAEVIIQPSDTLGVVGTAFTAILYTQPDGVYNFAVTATDRAGNVSLSSLPVNVIVNTAAVTPFGITVTDDVAPSTGTVANGGATNDTTPTISGQIATGTTQVQLFDNGSNVPFATITTTTSQTTWSYTGTLATGLHSITAVATNVRNNVSTASTPYTFTVDTTAPIAAAIASANDDVGSVQGVIGNRGSTDDTLPVLTGTTEAGATVNIYRNGTEWLGQASVVGTTWTFQIPNPLDVGTHVFTAISTDAAGNVGATSASFALTVVGPITASSPTFPTGTPRSVSTSITTFSVIFNTPVAGFSVGNLRLYRDGRAVSLKGASVRLAGNLDGTTWSVTLPSLSIRSRGLYRLDILPGTVYSTLTGGVMSQTQSLSWRRL